MARTRQSDCKASEREVTVSRRAPVTYDSCLTKEELDRLFAADDKYLAEVISVPRKIALDKSAPHSARLAAAENYLNRRVGKVPDKTHYSGGMKIEVICDGE